MKARSSASRGPRSIRSSQLDPIYATFNPPDTDLPRDPDVSGEGRDPGGGHRRRRERRRNIGASSPSSTTVVGRSTGTITARATIENPNQRLLPGQFIRVRLHVTDQPNTLLVPQVAVGSSQLGKYLYVVGQDDKVEQRFVTLGADYDPLVAVSKGVAEGESVVVGNLLKLGPGMLVKPVPAQPRRQSATSQGGGG